MITFQEWKQKKNPKNEIVKEGSEEYKQTPHKAFIKTDKEFKEVGILTWPRLIKKSENEVYKWI